jgi:ankyrin repeat and fibronectin type-III domain-containing protein 1
MEVVEVSPEVSFMVMVPSADSVCAVPGSREKEEPLLKREDLLLLPVQTFEMAHLSTYQRDLINRYSRLSSILETDTILAQHTHREVTYSKNTSRKLIPIVKSQNRRPFPLLRLQLQKTG